MSEPVTFKPTGPLGESDDPYHFLPSEDPERELKPLTWDPSIFQMPVNIMSREAWGALPPKKPGKPMKLPLLVLYFTYSDTDQCSSKRECIEIMQSLQKRHMDEGHNDIHFNYLVGGDGNIYEGAGWDNVRDPKRPEYDDEDKCAIAYIRRGEDDEDEKAQKMIWLGSDFLDWAYPAGCFR